MQQQQENVNTHEIQHPLRQILDIRYTNELLYLFACSSDQAMGLFGYLANSVSNHQTASRVATAVFIMSRLAVTVKTSL